jgi:hypothetical protein
VIDVDDGSPLEPILEAIDGLFVLVHTTYSATPDAERWRVVVPLDRPVGADAYDRVWRWIASALEEVGVAPDYGGAPACQPWAVPCIPPSGFYRHQETPGAFLDVAQALIAIPAPEPPPIVAPTPKDETYDRRVDRARKYVATIPPAISGSGGHSATFLAAQILVRGFMLEPDDALALLCEFNERCLPPWTPNELRHKIRQAIKRGTMTYGKLI